MHRPLLQARYQDYFVEHQLAAAVFPTTTEPALPIAELGHRPGGRSPHYPDNTEAGSAAGLPGLSLFAGLTPAGLPVGIELDGPVGSDRRLLALGLAFEDLLGRAPVPVQ